MLAYCLLLNAYFKGTIYRDITDSDQRRFLLPPKTEGNSACSVHAVY